MLRPQATNTTFSSAGQRSLQGYSQFVNFQVQNPILHEKSLHAETYKIPLDFAQQRNKLEYIKGLNSYNRRGIEQGPYMLNFLNRKRNLERMRSRVMEQIEDKIADDKYYIYDYNIREAERELRQGPRNRSVVVNTPRRRNIFKIQQQDSQYEQTVTSRSQRRMNSNGTSNSNRSEIQNKTTQKNRDQSYTPSESNSKTQTDELKSEMISKDLKQIKEKKAQPPAPKKQQPKKKQDQSSDESEDEW